MGDKRLIDANAFKSFLCECCNILRSEEPCEPSDCNVLAVIDEQPTVDAVEVVRCKDCKHWKHIEDGFGDCTNRRFHLDGSPDPTMNMDDFCSCGERREGEF